jgi:hypothetical protein
MTGSDRLSKTDFSGRKTKTQFEEEKLGTTTFCHLTRAQMGDPSTPTTGTGSAAVLRREHANRQRQEATIWVRDAGVIMLYPPLFNELFATAG